MYYWSMKVYGGVYITNFILTLTRIWKKYEYVREYGRQKSFFDEGKDFL